MNYPKAIKPSTGGVHLDALTLSELVKQAGHDDVTEVPSVKIQRGGVLSLGNAFYRFRCLHTLDLGRNLLTSFDGLQYCVSLERLSFYYNRIGNVYEINKLSVNSKLRDLDLRLNPVTRTEHYRSYVLAHLRDLQRLDEREVSENERLRAFRIMKDTVDEYNNSSNDSNSREIGKKK